MLVSVDRQSVRRSNVNVEHKTNDMLPPQAAAGIWMLIKRRSRMLLLFFVLTRIYSESIIINICVEKRVEKR